MNPTVVLFGIIFTAFFTALGLATGAASTGLWGLGALFLFQTLMIFLLFTPLHEGVHRSISKRRWVNEAILVGCYLVFLNSSFVFRRLHISHHAHTNQKMDPDHFTSSENLAMRWGRSFLLLLHYYFFAVRHYFTSFWFKVQLIVAPFIILVPGLVFAHFGRLEVFLCGWFAPMFVGVGLLAFMNTSLPHHPAKETARLRNTRNLYVPRWLEILMCHQNLHLVHHLHPTLPWYRYSEYWEQNREKLLAQGAQVADLRS